jgi:hypothetical protein
MTSNKNKERRRNGGERERKGREEKHYMFHAL